MTLRALGGGELKGEKLVRLIYVDESGIGPLDKNPTLVVAGVIFHDNQLAAVKRHIAQLVEKNVKPEERAGFYFHAADLFHGRENPERDHAILEELCSLPQKYSLQVVVGAAERGPIQISHAHLKQKDRNSLAHTLAMTFVIITVERYMRLFGTQEEFASFIIEDNTESRKAIRNAHRNLQDTAFVKQHFDKPLYDDLLPLQRIQEEVWFGDKRQSALLQVADACAFVLRRKLAGISDANRFYAPISSQIPRASRQLLSDEKAALLSN